MSQRILIVDDNPTNLRLATSVLELENFHVDQAIDAEQVLAYLAVTLPDLILMDIALPGMDGLALTRLIKADPRLQAIPVVALTAFAMKEDEQKARDAGCSGFLAKPIDTRLFARQVAGFIETPGPGKVLIVDDNPANLRLLRAQMEAEGWTVVEAAHGVEALDLLDRQAVDGVISDILMPHMDGYRLCMEVRKQPRFADLPFLLYTSTYDSPADRKLASAAGADDYIAKPAPVKALLESMARAKLRVRPAPVPIAELEDPVLKQYSESLIRKLEEKSNQLGAAYEGLAQVEARLSGLVESALDAIIALDQSQNVVLFNAAAETMFGCSRDVAMRHPIDRFLPARFQAGHGAQISDFAAGGCEGRRMGARIVSAVRSNGEEFPVEASISRLNTSRGWLFTVFLRDVTQRLRAEQSLAQSEARLRRVNRVMAVLSGINSLIVRATSREQLLAESCRIAIEAGAFPNAWIGLVDPADGRVRFAAGGGDPAFLEELREQLAEQDSPRHAPWLESLRELRPVVINDLQVEPVALRTSLTSSSRSLAALPLSLDGVAVGVLVLHASEPDFFDSEEMQLLAELSSDISFALDHLSKSDQIRYLANCDPLTGLANRSAFLELLARALKSRSGDEMVALLLLDIERFRRVNETLGRAAGDDLLRQVGARLLSANDSAARLGVDVFALKLRGSRTASEIAHAFKDLAGSCFDEPYLVHDTELRIGCRAGIAVFPADGADVEILMGNAEAALRRARQSAERCVFYAPGFNASAAQALGLESQLRRAIEHEEFLLHYQPKVDMVTRRVVGLEALIRWRSPGREGLVPPGEFIPVLEECGLIGEVGAWALRQALRDQAEFWSQGVVAPRIAVNVSPLQLRRPGFAAEVIRLVSQQSLAELELEITESVIMDDVERNIVELKSLREAGVTVAVDDFGTGYCSLAYIARLPIHSLKIDRSFVVAMTSGPEGLAIVSSIIALAHALRLTVVAEGVETEEQARLLHLLGCDEAQGYLFSRPVSPTDISELLHRAAPLP